MNKERVQKKILEVTASLAKYEMDVWAKVGPGVQSTLLDAISAITPEGRIHSRELVIAVCEAVLSPEIEGAVWKANSVMLRTGAVPVIPEIAKIRDKAISFLFELFRAARTDAERRELIGTLRRAGYSGGRTETGDELLRLTLSDATRVVDFLLKDAGPLSYELMASLEHDYWYDYRRARDISTSRSRVNCREIAIQLMIAIEKLRDKFNEDPTFAKFKVLVGFESVFPHQWKERDDDKADDYAALEQYRTDQASKYVDSVDDQNEAEWFELIERIASVESNDLATFPPFTRFLTQLSSSKPRTAARLLDKASESVARFLPAILAGLNESGDSETYDEQVTRILQGRKYLAELARHLRLAEGASLDLKERTLHRAIDVQHDVAVAECLIMAMEAKPQDVPPKEKFFELAIHYLNRKQAFWWVRAHWIARQASSFFASLSKDQASLLMPAMVHAPRVEYQVEQVLIQIAKHYSALVWECFASRLVIKREGLEEHYEAIPYQLHGLEKELSKDAKLAIKFGRKMFEVDARLFRFRGGRLLSAAFPSCPSNFANELAKLASKGVEADVKFVLAVMENYHGEETTQEVLKQVIAKFPNDDNIRTSVVISLENTGVVMGEFGFANALREKLEIARTWLTDPRPEVRAFAEGHIRSLELRIASEQRRAEERKALRELEYDRDDELPE
ncbi:MAG: hypothetical protein WDO17_01300 [Alphaproteobacteria bacterium]